MKKVSWLRIVDILTEPWRLKPIQATFNGEFFHIVLLSLELIPKVHKQLGIQKLINYHHLATRRRCEWKKATLIADSWFSSETKRTTTVLTQKTGSFNEPLDNCMKLQKKRFIYFGVLQTKFAYTERQSTQGNFQTRSNKKKISAEARIIRNCNSSNAPVLQ